MCLHRSLAVILLIVVPTAGSAPGDKIDPAKLKDKVTISLGKKLFVQFERKNDVLSRPKIVKQAGEKPPTPTFDFGTMDDNLMLMTQNPFSKDLKFRAAMRLKGRKDYVETSIVPVRSGRFSIELWRDAIEELVLFDFKLTDKG
jgi:hypothetical protein